MKKALLSLAACLASLAMPLTALADNISIVNFQPNTQHFAVADATGGYTNATTSATDIPAATVTVPKTMRPLTGNSAFGPSGVAEYLKVCYSADVTKATAGTGTINLVVNGVTVTAAARSSAVIGKNSLSMCYALARPTAAAYVVKLQGVSSDTNTFTVTNATMTVETLRFN